MFNLTTREAPPEHGLVPVDLPFAEGPGICIPKGCRVLSIMGSICRVPGPNGSTRLYAHPDDVAALKARNDV
jgi:hypothetical protein